MKIFTRRILAVCCHFFSFQINIAVHEIQKHNDHNFNVTVVDSTEVACYVLGWENVWKGFI